jgi:hypothetical protein
MTIPDWIQATIAFFTAVPVIFAIWKYGSRFIRLVNSLMPANGPCIMDRIASLEKRTSNLEFQTDEQTTILREIQRSATGEAKLSKDRFDGNATRHPHMETQ